MRIKSAAITNVGRVRQNNEDNFFLCGQYRTDVSENNLTCTYEGAREVCLFSVCDGMGGEAFGEIASLIAVRRLSSCESGLRKHIEKYIEEANGEICAEITAHGGRRIGTTVAIVEISGGCAYAFNVGDSRIYHINKDGIRQISEDHTQIQMLLRQGFVDPEAAKIHPARHVLTQHLGIFPEEMLVEPYASEPIKLEVGDVLLLCSDGLTDAVSDEDILKTVRTGGNPEQMANTLVESALNQGSRDNVTAVLAEITDSEARGKGVVDKKAAEKILKKYSSSGNMSLINEIVGMISDMQSK